MAGTPCYMAPEMLGAVGATLSEQTDVYLLGAVLHEVLTGVPPHQGTFRQIVASILLSTFRFPPEVPKELAEMAIRAMSREPKDRFASAKDLRLRLEWYLRHRGSIALSREATLRFEEVRSLAANASRRIGEHGGLRELRERLHHLFAESRFGFRQALRESAENESARDGLRGVTEIVVNFELEHGHPEAAGAALAELDDPPPALAKRVADALAAREEERRKIARLEKLEGDLDPSIGRRTRVTVAVVCGLVWATTPELASYLTSHGMPVTSHSQYTFTGLLALFALLAGRWGRESLTKTMVNRRLLATSLLVFGSQLALEVGGHFMGTSWSIIGPLHLLVWFIGTSAAALFVDKRIWPGVVGFLVGFFVAAAKPALVWHVFSITNLLLMINFAVAWWRPREDAPRRVIRERRRARLERERASNPPV